MYLKSTLDITLNFEINDQTQLVVCHFIIVK